VAAVEGCVESLKLPMEECCELVNLDYVRESKARACSSSLVNYLSRLGLFSGLYNLSEGLSITLL